MHVQRQAGRSSHESDADLLELLNRFGDAWNRHDLDLLTFRDGQIAIKSSFRKNHQTS